MTIHGGDVLSAVERYGGELNAYLDFSANINPLGPPSAVLQLLREQAADPHSLMRYPDPRYRALRETIALHTNCAPEAIVVANGTTALLDAVIHALGATSCLLPTPAFSEYQRALSAAGSRTIRFPLPAENSFVLDFALLGRIISQERPDLCILTNPHNPSGLLLSTHELQAFIEFSCSLKLPLILDEAFIDYVPEQSLTHLTAQTPNLIVLRSLTKFYAMPAMRVGYAVTSPALAKAITAQIPSWPITTLAADVAAAALGDPAYEKQTRTANHDAREKLAHALNALGLHVWSSAANFLFFKTGGYSGRLSANLARRRILIRDCASYEGLEQGGYIRVAVRTPTENQLLIEALAAEL